MPRVESLTAIEVDTLALVADGRDWSWMAEEMGCGREAIKSRVKSIRTKLGARNSPHAVAIAIRRGIIN